MYTASQYPVTLQVRRFTGYSLRERAQRVESINDDFDLVTIDFLDEDDALKSILWFGDDIVVLEPEDLKSKVINALKRIVGAHE
jgi:proteasome accessory factor B